MRVAQHPQASASEGGPKGPACPVRDPYAYEPSAPSTSEVRDVRQRGGGRPRPSRPRTPILTAPVSLVLSPPPPSAAGLCRHRRRRPRRRRKTFEVRQKDGSEPGPGVGGAG